MTGNSQESEKLFAYGTLMIPEIWTAVTGLNFEATSATLSGYQRFRVKGADFPAIIHTGNPEDRVTGLVFQKVGPASLAALDRYEDEFYRRQPVQIRSDDKGNVDALTYVLPAEHRNLLTGEPWSLEQFRHDCLSRYLDFLT